MKRTRQEKVRLGLIFLPVCLFFIVVIARLIHLQLILGPQYGESVERQSSGRVSIPAARGFLFDRNGDVVANNIYLSSLYASPRDNAELRGVERYLERLFNLEKGAARKKYGLAAGRFRWIKRRLADSVAARIALEGPSGLYLRQEAQREYPFGLVGKQISHIINGVA